jgi:hypothetical protein
VFGNQATATVMGRGNTIVGGTRSVIVGDGYIVSENTIAGDNITSSSFNGVAVGITPLVYCATLSQLGVADPTAQVKNDSLGGVTWTRTGVGTYQGYLDGFGPSLIPSFNVPTIIINNVAFDGVVSATYTVSSNTISVTTSQIGVGFADAYLDDTTIEVKYYQS